MDKEFVPTLVEQLSERDGRVRERARHTLVVIGALALPSLLELAGSSVKQARWEAAKALASISDPSSAAAELKLLSDPESDIRWLAGLGLIRIGPSTLPDVLRTLIDNADSIDLRRSVHHVLGGLAGENPVVKALVAPVLQVLGESDPSGVILARADEALKQIQSLRLGLEPRAGS
jgi:HEAT repeat protein